MRVPNKGVVQVAPSDKGTNEKLEFKARWFHNDWVNDSFSSRGLHNPRFHIDPFKVAPPLRGDAWSYCDKCNKAMISYEDLPEEIKNLRRVLVSKADYCNKAWKEYKEKNAL